MQIHIKLLFLIISIFSLEPKCQCYKGENSIGDIFILRLQDSTYMLTLAVYFHGTYTPFSYKGIYYETDSTLLLPSESVNGKPILIAKKNKNTFYMERDLTPVKYRVKMTKVNCKKIKPEWEKDAIYRRKD